MRALRCYEIFTKKVYRSTVERWRESCGQGRGVADNALVSAKVCTADDVVG